MEVQQRHDHELAALKRLFELGAKSYKEYEPDNAYTCRLTMEVGLQPLLLSRCSAMHAPQVVSVAATDCNGFFLQVFREPVITPSGLSYEGSALQEHLNKASRI